MMILIIMMGLSVSTRYDDSDDNFTMITLGTSASHVDS